ncbi:MAG: flippase [Candidatus Accumulibacter propinquus]
MTSNILQPLQMGIAQYVKNSAWLLLEQAIRLVSGLLVGVQVARHLGPAHFGNLSYALAVVSIAVSLSRLGLDSIIVGRLVRNPGAGGTIISTALGLRLMGAGAALSLVLLLVPWMSTDPTERIYIIIIAAGLLFQAVDVVDFLYQASARNGDTAQLRMVQILISSGLRLVLIWEDAGLSAFVFATLIDQIVLATAYGLLIRRRSMRSTCRYHFDRPLARALVTEAGPLFLSSTFVAAYIRIDQVLVQHLLGPKEIGQYVAATNLSEALYFVPTMIGNVVFPMLVAAYQSEDRTSLRLRCFLYRTLVLSSIAIAATTSVLAPQLIGFLYGPRFEPASDVLAIHAWTLVFVAYSAVFAKILIAQGYQRLLPKLTLTGIATNAAGLWLLVPTLGLRGAAFAAVLSHSAIAMALLLLHGPARTDLVNAVRCGKRTGLPL